MRDIRVEFSSGEKKYNLFIIKKLFKTKIYLSESVKGSNFSTPIPAKISTSTYKEVIKHWLLMLKRYLVKKGYKKCS